jgi:hypothetical protein
MKAATTLISAVAALALAAPASAQLAGSQPNAANTLDYPQPFVTEAVRAGVSVLWLQWQEDPTQKAQFCLDGRVIEDPAHGRVALIETVTRVESGSDCRGEWTLGSLAARLARVWPHERPGYREQQPLVCQLAD